MPRGEKCWRGKVSRGNYPTLGALTSFGFFVVVILLLFIYCPDINFGVLSNLFSHICSPHVNVFHCFSTPFIISLSVFYFFIFFIFSPYIHCISIFFPIHVFLYFVFLNIFLLSLFKDSQFTIMQFIRTDSVIKTM